MKIPFDIGLPLILRLLLPGTILAAALFPAAVPVRDLAYPGLGDGLLFTILGLLAGLTFLILDMPVYMLLEGRRYWPGWLRRWGLAHEAKRLERLMGRADAETDKAKQVELDLLAAQFPIDRKTGKPAARYPTRLGNLLASFETYPTVKYGLDGVFFWPRLWVAIDKDLRDELDGAQAVVAGAIYGCAALAVASFICLIYAFAFASWLDPDWRWLAGSLGCIAFSFACYRAALPRYDQYGALFAAVFDQHRSKLDLGNLLADLDAHMEAAPVPLRSKAEEARAVWRFLRWHRYRKPGGNQNEIVQDWLP